MGLGKTKYIFDEVISRKGTDCVKYDLRKLYFGTEDVIPMWVADMDFRTPDFIIEAIRRRLDHEILGYSIRSEEYSSAISNWMLVRHNWQINPAWISFSPGVVPDDADTFPQSACGSFSAWRKLGCKFRSCTRYVIYCHTRRVIFCRKPDQWEIFRNNSCFRRFIYRIVYHKPSCFQIQ